MCKAQTDTLILNTGAVLSGRAVNIVGDTLYFSEAAGIKMYSIYDTEKLVVAKKNPNKQVIRDTYKEVKDNKPAHLIFPKKDGEINYSGIVVVDNVTKAELYRRARKWFIDTYKSAKDVLQLEDKENGEVIGKGFFEELWQVTFYANELTRIYTTVAITVKDGRYKYEIKDFRIQYFVNGYGTIVGYNVDSPLDTWAVGYRPENISKFFAKVDGHVKDMIASLEKAMKTKTEDDW